MIVEAKSPAEAYAIAVRRQREEMQAEAVEPPMMQTVGRRISAIREQQLRELRLKLFPEWPDDRRGAPNTVIRSAIFGVIRRRRRRRVTDLPVAGPSGWSMTMTGWRLDQHDCDIWLEVHHLARNTTPGDEVRFTMHSMLRRLGRTSKLAGDDYVWLEARLKALYETTLLVDSGRHVGGAGNLIRNFRIDRETGEAVVETNPSCAPSGNRSRISRWLIGTLVCGAKAVSDSYARDERDTLETVARSVGHALDGIRVRELKREVASALSGSAAFEAARPTLQRLSLSYGVATL